MSLPPRTAVMSSSGRPMTASQTFFTSNAIPSNLFQIPDGKYTFTIYSLVKQQRFLDVIRALEYELQTRTPLRSSLSLLGYSYFQLQDFESATQVYSTLCQLCPKDDRYKIYLAQCYYRTGAYDEANSVCLDISPDGQLNTELSKLQLAIQYELNDIAACEDVLAKSSPNEFHHMLNSGCLMFKQMKFKAAIEIWKEALQKFGANSALHYNIALGCYMDKDYAQALQYVTEVIEKSLKDHPDFIPTSLNINENPKLVSNSQVLHESRLVEAYNLKAAIEKHVSDDMSANNVLSVEMPQRSNEDVDAITLHNSAILNFQHDVEDSFAKLNHLLQIDSAPAETLLNSLLLCLHNELFDNAADLLATLENLAETNIDPKILEYIKVTLSAIHSLHDAHVKFEDMEKDLSSKILDAMKQVQEARDLNNDEKIKEAIDIYDDCIDVFLAVIISHAKAFWNLRRFNDVDMILKKSVDFLVDRNEWKLAVANVLFVQEKYAEALSFYEPIIQSQQNNLLSLKPIVLANTCVSYILSNQNSLAEDLMKAVEHQESVELFKQDSRRYSHLCIINLAIGVLYCSRGNYEFGLSRIVSSFDPMEKKLNAETWLIAKKVLVSLAEISSKQMLILKDDSTAELLLFFDEVEKIGRKIPLSVSSSVNIAHEARKLKKFFFLE